MSIRDKCQLSLHNLQKALNHLNDALQLDQKEKIVIYGTIQCFEIAIELYWKTLKRLLESEGIIANSPKQTLREAYAAHMITDEATWLQMLNDRNLTSHIYDESTALRIYNNIKTNFPVLEKTFHTLQLRFDELSG